MEFDVSGVNFGSNVLPEHLQHPYGLSIYVQVRLFPSPVIPQRVKRRAFCFFTMRFKGHVGLCEEGIQGEELQCNC